MRDGRARMLKMETQDDKYKQFSCLVTCNSHSLETEIENAVLERVMEAVNNHASLNMASDESQSLINRFRELYTDSLHSHLIVNGRTWEEGSDTNMSSQESSDSVATTEEERRNYLSQKLNPEVAEGLVLTTQHRKQIPYHCAQACAQVAKHTCSYYGIPGVLDQIGELQEAESLRITSCNSNIDALLLTPLSNKPTAQPCNSRRLEFLPMESTTD